MPGVASGVAVALAVDLVATGGAVFASQVVYSQTLAGIVLGMLRLGEQLPVTASVAPLVVVLGFSLGEPNGAGDDFWRSDASHGFRDIADGAAVGWGTDALDTSET